MKGYADDLYTDDEQWKLLKVGQAYHVLRWLSGMYVRVRVDEVGRIPREVREYELSNPGVLRLWDDVGKMWVACPPMSEGLEGGG